MGPQPTSAQTHGLFRARLDEQINLRHLLVRLAGLIDWSEIERTFGRLLHLQPRPPGAAAATGRWAAVLAAHLRCLRRGSRQHLGGEPRTGSFFAARSTCRLKPRSIPVA